MLATIQMVALNPGQIREVESVNVKLVFPVQNAPIKLIFYPLLVVQRVNFIQQMTIGASIVFVWEYLRIVRELQSNVNLQICLEVWKKWISMRKPCDFHSPTRISRKRSVNCRSILGVENFTSTKYKTSNQIHIIGDFQLSTPETNLDLMVAN